MTTRMGLAAAALVAIWLVAVGSAAAAAAGHSLAGSPTTTTVESAARPAAPARAPEPAGAAVAVGPAVVSITGATLDASQRQVVLDLRASAGDPCIGTGRRWFTATADISTSAARVQVIEHYAGPPAQLPAGAQCVRTLIATPYRLTLVLTTPLGSRTLIAPDGREVPVGHA